MSGFENVLMQNFIVQSVEHVGFDDDKVTRVRVVALIKLRG